MADHYEATRAQEMLESDSGTGYIKFRRVEEKPPQFITDNFFRGKDSNGKLQDARTPGDFWLQLPVMSVFIPDLSPEELQRDYLDYDEEPEKVYSVYFGGREFICGKNSIFYVLEDKGIKIPGKEGEFHFMPKGLSLEAEEKWKKTHSDKNDKDAHITYLFRGFKGYMPLHWSENERHWDSMNRPLGVPEWVVVFGLRDNIKRWQPKMVPELN